jgi:hypothetical protein
VIFFPSRAYDEHAVGIDLSSWTQHRPIGGRLHGAGHAASHDARTRSCASLAERLMKQVLDSFPSTGGDRSALARQVQELVARLNPTVALERRRDERMPVPVLFRLTPLDNDRQPIVSAAVTVVGKNISRRGFSFYHEQPLTHRRAVISVQHPEISDFSAEIDVTWCRFTKPGWYESGGRLVSSVSSSSPPLVHLTS